MSLTTTGAEKEKNTVQLVGKVSRLRSLRYAPSGKAVLELTLAVNQRGVEKASVGYFELLITDVLAEQVAAEMRVGQVMEITGSLWNRRYRDRAGIQKEEMKIIVQTIGGLR